LVVQDVLQKQELLLLEVLEVVHPIRELVEVLEQEAD
jgi:hypothetical protein